MKTKTISTFLCLFLMVPYLSYGQIYEKKNAEKIVGGSKQVRLDEKNKSVKFIQLRDDVKKSATDQDAWLSKSLKFTKHHNLKLLNKETDKKGYTHYKYQIHYKNIPVEHTVYTVHSMGDRVRSANGEYVLGQDISITPQLKEQDAFDKVINYVHAEKYLWEGENAARPKGKLVIYPVDSIYVLVYKFDIYAIKPLSHQYIYVNANTGAILKALNCIQTSDAIGTAETIYYGTVNITTDYYNDTYRLRDYSRGGGIETYNFDHNFLYLGEDIDFTDSDNHWNDTTDNNNAAYDAHHGAEVTYDYYYSRFGRNSFDNIGSPIKTYVHFLIETANAAWDGYRVLYGDGDGITFSPFTSLDIVGHEITHGVTQYSAGLIYKDEAGALNESFSDIFGTAIDFYKYPNTANYLMGDVVSVTHTSFRSMQDPNVYGCPDTYHGCFWDVQQEVHTNSGVMNYWFYLLCEGGTGINDLGDSYSVSAIGMDKATQIAYRNLTVYLTPNSNYADARFYSIQSAIDLFGDCSPEVVAVTNAWYAVGVGSLFNNAINTDFFVSKTSACDTPATICFYNRSINASSYLWDFGDGTTDTVKNPIHTYINAGTFPVRLFATGNTLCESIDTIKQFTVSVTNGQQIVPPSCMPHTINPGQARIFQFIFNTINKQTDGLIDDYVDYSCTDMTTITEGMKYDLSVRTLNMDYTNVYIWIDLNNDGQFDNTNELIFQKNLIPDPFIKSYSGKVIIPRCTQYGVPLRLRIASDIAAYPIVNACSNSNYGQVQDYAVIIQQNTSAPEAAFSSNEQKVICGDTVEFKDNSLNSPASWQWNFPGGNPSLSTLQNPKVVYTTPGNYDVILITTKDNGSDTVVKREYISVITPAPIGFNANLQDSTKGIVRLQWHKGNENGVFEDFNDVTVDNFVFPDKCFKIENGSLKAIALANDVWKSAFCDRDFRNFTLEVKFQKVQGKIDTPLGFFVRSNGSFESKTERSGYMIEFSASGYYGITIFKNDRYRNLVSFPTTCKKINTGYKTWNTATIEAVESKIKIFINNQFIYEICDTNNYSGKIGLVGRFASGYTEEYNWDYLNIYPHETAQSNLNIAKTGESVLGEKGDSVSRLVDDTRSFQYFKIYRDSVLIDSTRNTNYIDTLPGYGKHRYSVSALYNQWESVKNGPTDINWTATPGEDCTNAVNLASLTSPYSGTTFGRNDFTFCNMTSLPDRIFYIDLQPGDSLFIGLTSCHSGSRHTMRVGGSCPGNTELICKSGYNPKMYTYYNDIDTIQRVYWIQAGYSYGSTKDFTLKWKVAHSACPRPNHLNASSIYHHSALLGWMPGNTETKWDIEWGLSGFKLGEGTLITGLNVNAYALNDLLLNTKYDFYVKAKCDSSNESAWTSPCSFVTKALDKPFNLVAELKDISTGRTEVNWNAPGSGFYDEFEDSVARNWIPLTGEWSVKNGYYINYTLNDVELSSSYYNADFANFEYEVKMRAVNTLPILGLNFNGNPKIVKDNWSDCYFIDYSFDGYLALLKRSGGIETTIMQTYSADIAGSPGAWNTLKVKRKNGYIEIYINGKLQGTYFDSTLKSGKVGIHTYSMFNKTEVDIDYVRLTPLNDSLILHPEYYNVYRDNILIASTNTTTYSDALASYGIHEYKVTAIYNNEGESEPTNPVQVDWSKHPVIAVSPLSFTDTLMKGQSLTHILKVSNDGFGKLNFSVVSRQKKVKHQRKWLSFAPSCDTLTSGRLVNIVIKYRTKNLVAKDYSDTLFVSSNDKDNPMIKVPCALTILKKPKANVPDCKNKPLTEGALVDSYKSSNNAKLLISDNSIIFYPNPFDDILNVKIFDNTEVNRIEISNAEGTIVKAVNPDKSVSFTINMSSVKPGLYNIRLYKNKGMSVYKMVKIK